MQILISLFIGAIGGFIIHAFAIKVNFKQAVIEDKKRYYSSIISQWLKMRNFIYDNWPGVHSNPGFDRLYAKSMAIAGGILLICQNTSLSQQVETLNDQIYRTAWDNLTDQKRDEMVNTFKHKAWTIIQIMRLDIEDTSRLEMRDLIHVFKGLFKR